MSNKELSNQIQALVDSLRNQTADDVSLKDVAGVTEVLIGTMQAFFSSVDTSIYNECRSLSDYMTNARAEIASLAPSDSDNEGTSRAGLELDAIVKATEEATETIMNSAENVMNALESDDLASQKENIEGAMMDIFEACSFQDITGQRISKVVETLAHIDERVSELVKLLGITEDQIQAAQKKGTAEKHDPLARGPSLEGEGIDQSTVDALLDDGDDQAKSKGDQEMDADDIDALFN